MKVIRTVILLILLSYLKNIKILYTQKKFVVKSWAFKVAKKSEIQLLAVKIKYFSLIRDSKVLDIGKVCWMAHKNSFPINILTKMLQEQMVYIPSHRSLSF